MPQSFSLTKLARLFNVGNADRGVSIDGSGNPILVPTPAQFDASTKLATMEAVQRALGNHSGFLSGVGQTLVPGHCGKVIEMTGTNQTYILPLVASCALGSKLAFWNFQGNPSSITRQATDVLYVGTDGTQTSIVMSPGDTAEFTSAGSFWFLSGGSKSLAGSSSVFGASKAATGYQKLPSGLIIQWGTVAATIGGTAVSFPIAYPNAVTSLGIATYSGGTVLTVANTLLSTGFNAVSASGTPSVSWISLGY